MTLAERFWTHVDQRGTDECWPWTGELNSMGYGRINTYPNGRRVRLLAHRLAAQMAGLVIEGQVVRHKCDNPQCVNPFHLLTGSQADNMQDSIKRGRFDKSGLSLTTWPPRPCRRCGATVHAGRRRYCDVCKSIVKSESQARYRAQRRQRRGVTSREP